MAAIRPISDLRNRTHEIEAICRESGEPVFISKNGKEALVVLSHARYEQMEALMALYSKLDGSEADEQAGDHGITHEQMIRLLRDRIG